MKNIFISSVVGDFEEYRRAASRAVELIGHKSVMCETFGARPYASETACITEVEGCDIYLLIMGERYGYKTSSGMSVTQTEYQAAKQAGKPILVFVQQVEMEALQLGFRREVEDFQGGLFRAEFSTSEQLKDEIIKGLRLLEVTSSALPESRFQERKDQALMQIDRSLYANGPQLVFSFWPQPQRDLDIVNLERELDTLFTKLCRTGLASLRDGYKPKFERDYTAIKSNGTDLFFFVDGLIVVSVRPTVEREGFYFTNSFVPPSRIQAFSEGVIGLVDFNGGWCGVDLRKMDHVCVEELPPEGTNSISMRMSGDSSASFSKLILPITPRSYLSWIDSCINRLKRIFLK